MEKTKTKQRQPIQKRKNLYNGEAEFTLNFLPMTQNIFAAAIISFGIILGGYLLGTQGFVISTAPAVKTLQVSADGKVKAIPDTVILSAGVEVHTRATQELAYQDMNQSINAVKEILNNAGVEEKNIQTSGLFA